MIVDSTTERGRPFMGFDEERATYLAIKDELLAKALGRFVVVVGSEFVGPFDSPEEALRNGYLQFGAGPLYLKQILNDEPVVELSRSIDPCRT